MEQLSLNDVLWNEISIQEPLNITSSANIAEKFVIEIALEYPMWLQQNRWFNYEGGKWRYTFEHGTRISEASYEKNFTKTNEELFNLFLKEKYGQAKRTS